MLLLTGIASVFPFSSCSTLPQGVTAVKSFDKEKYLGKWYEIARLDNRFERNLNNTTAHYSLNPNGAIKVVNRGFNHVTGEWSQATGKAKFVGSEDVARLKVSFFGPFYSGYNVIALDSAYQYALVSGSKRKYLWILAREPSIPEEVKRNYVTNAKNLGYDTKSLIWVKHNKDIINE